MQPCMHPRRKCCCCRCVNRKTKFDSTDPAALGLGTVNKTRALGLPDQCGVKTPPLSNCASAPTTSPSSGAPAGQTPTSSGAGT